MCEGEFERGGVGGKGRDEILTSSGVNILSSPFVNRRYFCGGGGVRGVRVGREGREGKGRVRESPHLQLAQGFGLTFFLPIRLLGASLSLKFAAMPTSLARPRLILPPGFAMD